MKKKLCRVIGWGIILLVAWPARWVSGQEPMGRARENIHRLRLIRMTEALDLSEEQTAAIYPVATRIEKEKTALLMAFNRGMRDLRQKISAENPDEAAILETVARLKELRANLAGKDREFEDFLDSRLTVIQRAKYLIFTAEFNRGLGEQINRARALMREKRGNP